MFGNGSDKLPLARAAGASAAAFAAGLQHFTETCAEPHAERPRREAPMHASLALAERVLEETRDTGKDEPKLAFAPHRAEGPPASSENAIVGCAALASGASSTGTFSCSGFQY